MAESKESVVFSKLIDKEKQRALSLLQGGGDIDAQQTSVAMLFGELSARMRVIEDTLVAADLPLKKASAVNQKLVEPLNEHKVSIEGFTHESLGYLQYSNSGHPYRLTQNGAEITTFLPVSRSRKLTLAIEFPDHEMMPHLKSVKIAIDGVELRTKVLVTDNIPRVLSHIPPSASSEQTHLSIKVPTGVSLPLADIYCVPKLSLMSAVAKLAKG